MLSLRQQLVTGSARLVNPGELNYTSVTFHETGNESLGASAAAHANLQSRGNNRNASWHATADHKEVVQSYSDTDRCRHAGTAAGNNTSWALELCVNSRSGFEATCRNGAQILGSKLEKKALSLSRLRQHNSWSGKNCPSHLRKGDWGITISDFQDMVNEALKGSVIVLPDIPQIVVPTPPPVPSPDLASPATRRIQEILALTGHYKGEIDGLYGPMTHSAVYNYQSQQNKYGAAGLFVDGLWGPKTEAWYNWVIEAQKAVSAYNALRGQRVAYDGSYGPVFHYQVKQVQGSNKLYVDGILGNKVTIPWMRSKGSRISNRP